MEITREQKKNYIADPWICPFCGSQNIEADMAPVVELNQTSQKICCDDCGAAWTDIYTMTDVEVTVFPTRKG